MPINIQESVIEPYTPLQMFALVNDVRAYPQFVPHCTKVMVQKEEAEWLRAEVHFAKGFLRHHFTTENRLFSPDRIEIQLVEGPFKKLSGSWRFHALPAGCRVELQLSFDFDNGLIQKIVQPFFEILMHDMVQAFGSRARQIYAR